MSGLDGIFFGRSVLHGTWQGVKACCPCAACRAYSSDVARQKYEADPQRYREASRKWRARNLAKDREKSRRWDARNRERRRELARRRRDPRYRREQERTSTARLQAASREVATSSGPWQAHEDALLVKIPSNVAAASALHRTYWSVKARRERLRKKGLLP